MAACSARAPKPGQEQLLDECNLHTIVRPPNSVFKPYASIGTKLLFFEKDTPTQEVWYCEHAVPDGQKAYSMPRPIRIAHLQPCAEWWGGADGSGRMQTERAWTVDMDTIWARGYNLDIKNPHAVAAEHGDPEELLAGRVTAEKHADALRDVGGLFAQTPTRIRRSFSASVPPGSAKPLFCFPLVSAVSRRLALRARAGGIHGSLQLLVAAHV